MKNIFVQFIFGLFTSTFLVGNASSASESVNNNARKSVEQVRAELSALVTKLDKISGKGTVFTVSEMENILEVILSKEVCEERAPGQNYSDCSYFSQHDDNDIIRTFEFTPEPNGSEIVLENKLEVVFNSYSHCISPQDLENAFKASAIFHPEIQYSSEQDKQTSIQKYGEGREYYFPQAEKKNVKTFEVSEKNGCAHHLNFSYNQLNEAAHKAFSEEFARNYPLPKLKKIPYQHKLALRAIQKIDSYNTPVPQEKVRNLFTGKALCTRGTKQNEVDCEPRRANSRASIYFFQYTLMPSFSGNSLYENFTWQINNAKHCIQERNLIKFFKKDSSPIRAHIIREPSIPEDNSLPPFFSDYEIILKNSHPYENYLVVEEKNHCAIEIKLFKIFKK